MKIDLFGGRNGPPISDYFNNRKRQLDALSSALKSQQRDENSRRNKIIETFTITPISINYSDRTILLVNEKYVMRMVGGENKKIITGTYQQSIPFVGDLAILQHSPIEANGTQIFHGLPKQVDVEQNHIITFFDAEKNYTEQMNYFAHETLGDYHDNQIQMNAAIKRWNDNLSTIAV